MNIDELMKTQPWATWSNPTPELPVGMLGGLEALLCYYLAKEAFRGVGTIVDGGSFLGKSTYFLAQGLRMNPCYVSGRDRIHSFDIFQVLDDHTIEFIRAYLARTVAIGDSTREIFDSQVASVRDMIEVHAGDFNEISWTPQPIEILFVDIAKSELLCRRVVEVFFPMLIPGESVVIHQDYHHPWLPFIHVTMEYLAEYFEVIVPRVDDSALFRCRAPIPPDVLRRAVSYDFSFEEQVALMDRAILRLPEEDRYYVQLARIVLKLGRVPESILCEELDKLERHFNERDLGYSKNTYFDAVRSVVDPTRALTIAERLDWAPVKKKQDLKEIEERTARENHRPWSQLSIPAEVENIPSMLSMDEKQYLIWLTAEKFEDWGAIVELGVWLGSSSAALAEGLRRRNSAARIHSFDLFRWESQMADVAGPVLKQGDDFLPLYLKETAAYAPWIEARKVDLMNASWDGGPIEILFVDSAKTWDLTNAILNGFARHLVPGRSRIVLQDFRYHYSHCLPLIFDSRPDVWKQIEDVQYATTVSFMPLKPLYGPSGIDTAYSEESFPLESADQILRSRMAREEPQNRNRVLQTLYRKYLIDGPMDEALQLRAQVVASGADEADLKYMENVSPIVGARGWKAFELGQYETARALAERCISIDRKTSVYASMLLGFSLLRLGDREGAKRAMNDVLSISPDFPNGRLLRVELAIAERRYAEAAAEALEVLKVSLNEESNILWSLCLLFQAWSFEGNPGIHVATLGAIADAFSHSPSFLTHLAIEQCAAGQRQEAIENLDRALALVPDYELAKAYRAQWNTQP